MIETMMMIRIVGSRLYLPRDCSARSMLPCLPQLDQSESIIIVSQQTARACALTHGRIHVHPSAVITDSFTPQFHVSLRFSLSSHTTWGPGRGLRVRKNDT